MADPTFCSLCGNQRRHFHNSDITYCPHCDTTHCRVVGQPHRCGACETASDTDYVYADDDHDDVGSHYDNVGGIYNPYPVDDDDDDDDDDDPPRVIVVVRR